MKDKELKICLVDDCDSFRQGIKYFLEAHSNWKIVQEYSSGEAFFNEVGSKEISDIIFMDYHLPGIDGISITREYLHRYPQVKVIEVSMHTCNHFRNDLEMAGFNLNNSYRFVICISNTNSYHIYL